MSKAKSRVGQRTLTLRTTENQVVGMDKRDYKSDDPLFQDFTEEHMGNYPIKRGQEVTAVQVLALATYFKHRRDH